MRKTPRVSVESIGRLAQYWFRADMMHQLVHFLREEYKYDLDKMNKDGVWWEFEAYLFYWLSGLFVTVEGFNKLGLKDARVQALFKEHTMFLKGMRHETYHFMLEQTNTPEMLRAHRLNWAEELHKIIGDYIRGLAGRKAQVERFLEVRSKSRRSRRT